MCELQAIQALLPCACMTADGHDAGEQLDAMDIAPNPGQGCGWGLNLDLCDNTSAADSQSISSPRRLLLAVALVHSFLFM
jgi:hypothetical protein